MTINFMAEFIIKENKTDWQDEKISFYWHKIMDDISWYSKEDKAYILARLIDKMATKLTVIVKKG